MSHHSCKELGVEARPQITHPPPLEVLRAVAGEPRSGVGPLHWVPCSMRDELSGPEPPDPTKHGDGSLVSGRGRQGTQRRHSACPGLRNPTQ